MMMSEALDGVGCAGHGPADGGSLRAWWMARLADARLAAIPEGVRRLF